MPLILHYSISIAKKSLERDLSENINFKRHSIALYLAEN